MKTLMLVMSLVLSLFFTGCTSTSSVETKPTASQTKEAVQVQGIEVLKNTSNFAPGALEHIFYGEINKRDKVVGYHYEGMPKAKAHVEEGSRSKEDKNGIYTGKVFIGKQLKDGNNGYSTFYPLKWSPQQVVDAINYAYEHKEKRTSALYAGKSKEGIEINFYIDEKTQKITTAYPVYKK